jgi:hypothetical protein
MSVLTFDDLRKKSSGGPYAGQRRGMIIYNWIKISEKIPVSGKKDPVLLYFISEDIEKAFLDWSNNGKSKKFLKVSKKNDLDKLTNTNAELFSDKPNGNGKKYKISSLMKTSSLVGKAGSKISAAAMTAYSESLQCYYCSALYNGRGNFKNIHLDPVSGVIPLPPMIDSTVQSYCFTYGSSGVLTFETCWEAVQNNSTWIEDGVFIKTAEAIKASKEGRKFSGTVRFHRGSPFMDEVYARRKRCIEHDKELAKDPNVSVKAPSSFSNDKWNPGDIWMSVLPQNTKNPFPDSHGIWKGKLGTDTCDWEALRTAVLTSAKIGITMGVSLKKIGTGTSAKVSSFNDYNVDRENVTLKGFTFGKNGDFFSSSDMYFHFSNGAAIQFRSFSGTKSWQGEIKGASANAGKIGGGGVNYYTEKHFGKSIGSATKVVKNTHNWTETKSVTMGDMYNLYKIWAKTTQHGIEKKDIPDLVKDFGEFETKCKGYKNSKGQSAGPAFIFSKNMCLLLLKTLEEGKGKLGKGKGGTFGQDIFRYAQSNTDYSSFYIKVS